MQRDEITGFRLSPQQRRIWRLGQQDGPGAYRARCVARIDGDLDVEALECSVREVARRHEVLRTGCVLLPGMSLPVQVVTDSEPTWLVFDPSTGAAGSVADALREEAPFDLESGQVFHASLLKLAPRRHALVLSLPSICADGVTLRLVLSEIASRYAGSAPDAVEPLQYTDVAAWQGELLDGDEALEGKAHWRARAALRSEPRLGIERPHGAGAAYDRRALALDLSLELSSRIEDLAQRIDVSPAAVLLAAWQALLLRTTGESCVTVGVLCDGRTYEELRDALGPLAKYLPVQSPEAHASLAQGAGQAQRALDENAEWQEYFCWDRLADEGGDAAARTLSFGFAFEDLGREFRSNGTSFAIERQDVTLERFRLQLVCARRDGRLHAELCYDSRSFDDRAAEKLAGQILELLRSGLDRPEVPVARLPLASADDWRELVIEANRTESVDRGEVAFHARFEAAAASWPSAPAVLAAGFVTSYAELDRKADRLAQCLSACGVRAEAIVGIHLARSENLVVALLAVLKAGGAYLPLDPEQPAERLAYMISDSGARCVLTESRLARNLADCGVPLVLADALPESPAVESPAVESRSIEARVDPDQLAYVIYTSGSTGRPKGTLLTQRGLANYVGWAVGEYALGLGAVVPVHSPFGFDLTVTSLLAPLAAGAAVRLLPDETGAEGLESVLATEHDLGLVKLTPSHLRVLAERLSAEKVSGRTRAFVIGGEALRWESLELWRTHAPTTRLINEYGPTETVVGCVVYEVGETESEPASGPVPIGRPIANMRVYLLDQAGYPLPVGVAGELFLGGAGLARGYARRPDLTADRFVPDPFGTEPGGRLYRTGDLCRWRADGNLEFLSRTDEQVKIRGHRVEPKEVESLLESLDSVEAAAVVPQEGPSGTRLVAYVVGAGGEKVTATELRRSLAERLPDYMVPAFFVPLAALPLTANGKVDRKALPAPGERLEREREYVEPATEVERELCRIWREVLGLERVGVRDNFFELGGDSILTIQVISRAARAGLRLTPQQMFQHQTVSELARVALRGGVVEAEQGLVTGEVWLTPIQRWLFERGLPEPSHYNQALMLELYERLSPQHLSRAVRALITHHDALRMRFTRTELGLRQTNAGEEPGFDLQWVDLGGIAEPARGATLASAVGRMQSSLDLERGPLVRVGLFELGGGSWRLLFVIHHLAVDGVSWRVLLEDLLSGYGQLAGGAERIELPLKTTSYRRWSELLSAHVASVETLSERSYWSGVVQRGTTRLPLCHAGGGNLQERAETLELELSEAETRALIEEVATAYRTRADEALLSVLAYVLGGWSGGGISVDVEGHGREDLFEGVDLSRTVGWFTTIYPVYLPLLAESGPGIWLRAVKESLRSVPRRGIGYGLSSHGGGEASGELRSPSEVLFNYLGRFEGTLPAGAPLGLARESVGPLQGQGGARSHVLELNGGVVEGRLRLAFTYGSELHDRATIAELADSFLARLRELIAHCRTAEAGGLTPSDFPLSGLDQIGLDRLLGRGVGLEDVYPLTPLQSGMLFHSLYEPETGLYFEQLSCRLSGDLEVSAFRRAWSGVVERHAVLRTRFAWEGLREPLQIVERRAELPWEELDWREMAPEEEERRLAAYLEADRLRGFDLTRAPLMRLALIRTGENAWRFVWSHHHLLLDGWSVSMLLREVLLTYEAGLRGIAVPLDPVPPYREHVRTLLSRERGEHAEYWRRALEGFSAPNALDLPRPAHSAASEARSEHRVRLSPAESARLDAFARSQQITLGTLVQGAWALLISRYAREEDVVYGVTVSGRAAPGTAGVVGLFINTLPVRVHVEREAPVGAWLRRNQETQAELLEHESDSLVEIQAASEVPRGVPLFESLLVFENYPVDETLKQRASAIEVDDVRLAERTNYPLTLVVSPGDELSLRLLYDPRRFDGEAIARLVEHYRILLVGLARSAEDRLETLGLCDDETTAQLSAWNETAAAHPVVAVHESFEEQARRTPDAVAVVAGETATSYEDLDRRSGRLARRLRSMGAGPGTVVALCAERSADLVTGVLGILRSGAAYLPIDPSHPAERLAFVVGEARPKALVVSSSLADTLPALDVRVLRLDEDRAWPSAEEPLDVRTPPDAAAYVLYTSGSTGMPKGVVMTHRALSNLLSWQIERFGPAHAVTLQFASVTFDVSFQEIFSTLCSGGRLVLPADETRRDPERLLAFVAERSVERLFLPFVALQQLALAAAGGSSVPRSLRQILTAGEQLQATPEIRALCQRRPALTLENQYGPTETHVVTAYLLPADPGAWPDLPPIGRPIDNTRVHLVDRAGERVGVGVPGELCVGGECLARGYWNRADLTAERFVPDRFSQEPGARLYRTGDLGRYRPTGEIEFLGRLDQQVKIRGFRVEPGEVEAVLRKIGGVRQAAVVARAGAGGQPTLVAYVVPEDATLFDVAACRAALSLRLPEYMVPSVVMRLEALPLTRSGKVDRSRLPAPEGSRFAASTAFAAPRDAVEEQIAAIWSSVLGIERVGVHDDFFELGGHSLLATQIVSRLRDSFEVELPLRELFEASTVAGLADAVRRARGRPEAPPILSASRDSAPLSFAQERQWVLDRLVQDVAPYNLHAAVRIRGPLDADVLERAFREVVHRHETLRTTFPAEDGRPVQRICSAAEFQLSLADLRELPSELREAELVSRATAAVRRRFDLAAGPLFGVHLVRLDAAEHVLLLVMHHIVSDGWSMGVLVRETVAIYGALLAGEPSPLPSPALQYADFARWQRDWLSGEVLDRQLGYWKQQLSGLGPLALPTDRPRPALQTFDGAAWPVGLGPELATELKRLAEQERVTPFMVLLAALQAVLSRYSGETDVAIGTPIAGRNRGEIESMVGFFVNTLVLRSDLSGDPTFRGLLARVRESCLGAYAHQDLPFEKLVAELRPERDKTRPALFQVMFTLQNVPFPVLELPGGISLAPETFDTGAVKFDLTLTMGEIDGRLAGTWGYNTRLFEPSTIERLNESFRRLLAAAVFSPGTRLSELPLLTAEERQSEVGSWNETRAALEGPQTVHARFAETARRLPEAIAVRSGSEELSYRALNERSTALAQVLCHMGVRAETPVAVCLPRSAEWIVALLGVLKAGGVYVPIDAALPRSRRLYMLEDSGAGLLITRGELAGDLLEDGPPLLLLDDLELESEEAPTALEPRATGRNLAYIIYTSGSTGRPKGVGIEHRGLCNLVQSQGRAFAVAPGERVLQFASPTFDASISEVFVTLVSGATLCLAPAEEILPGASLTDLIRRERISAVTLPPSVLAALPEVRLDSLRTLVSAGEACTGELVERWSRGRRFLNAYGPTENTVCATLIELHDAGERRIPIGRAMDNVRAYVLDRGLEPLPPGARGELCLGGVGLSRGYWNRPDLTAERFVPDPFADEPGARMFRTGDACRRRGDGLLEFLGRLDDQVKLRGFRIEPGEIEAALREHPAVRTAAVRVSGSRPEDARLVAYVVPETAEPPSAPELREHLGSRLPQHMIPALFVPLAALPLTPSGKLDRNALPEPGRTRAGSAQEYVEPRTPVERLLAETWAEVLGLECVGVDDDFFELGGDSIKGAILINKIQEKLGEYVYTVALFDAPTVANLARYLEQNNPEALARLFGTGAGAPREHSRESVVDAAVLTALRRVVRRVPPARPRGEPGNPSAVFVLSPPRSGSTLTRVMLAGHPRLFAPPELQLLNFDTLAERQAAFDNERDQFWLDGAIRALMEIRSSTADEARAIVGDCLARRMTTREFYGLMQGWIDDRLFVDKTPHYAMDLETLRRAERNFREPRYLHLVRHPRAMISSFERAKLHVFFPPFFTGPCELTPRQLAEALWVISHENILSLLDEVPAGRQHRVVFEDLLADPRRAMEGVASFLGLPFDEGMLEPHRERKSRMTDAIHPLARMLGDVRFHEHEKIDPRVAERSKQRTDGPLLAEETWDLAVRLGYERDEPRRTEAGPRPAELRPMARDESADELLARLDELSPDEVRSLLAELEGDGAAGDPGG